MPKDKDKKVEIPKTKNVEIKAGVIKTIPMEGEEVEDESEE